ncbi:MAG: hypothetical protein IJ149_03970 [Oscillospiraceae bacterium]|nr:hypothetical protein [Oscillospiraceae bacterium]
MAKKRRILSTFLAASMITTCMAGMSVPASADGDTSTYTITIPSTLDVSGAGYTQLTGGITATGSNISGKLTLSAESTNEWNLKDGTKAVPYKLTESNTSTDLKDSWEFAAADLTGTGKTENVYVYIAETDYNNAVPGTYTDTVTFTAKVENAVTAPTLAGVTLTDGMIIEPHCNVDGGDNWAQFKYVAADDKFVPNFNSYDDVYSKAQGDLMQPCADQWAYSVFEYNEEPDTNFYLTQSGNTVHLRADDGINMTVIDLQLDFDNMTYTQSYKQWYNEKSGSFTSIKIGDTTITASQMTAQ